jgi:AcrR family transcriptional regulator
MSSVMDDDGPETGPPATGRRAVRHTRTRAEILDAAAELITEQGAEAFNLTDLATRAGFSNAASLYRYFSSKKEIMGALMRRGLERLEEHLRGVPADLPPDEQLVEFCLAYVDYARAHPGERALLLTTTAVIAPEDRAASLPEEFVDRVFGLIAAVIESGGDAAPDEGDVFAMLHAVWALAQGMAEYDRLYTGPEREVLRSRHRLVFRAYVEGSKRTWSPG